MALAQNATPAGAQVSLNRHIEPLTINGDLFGAAVAKSGDILVATAVQSDRDSGFPRLGAAFVYQTTLASGLTRIATLSPTDVVTGDENQFGTAVAVDGNTIAIGDSFARSDAGELDDSGGAVYVFRRNEATNYVQIARLSEAVPPLTSSSDQLGFSLDLSGSLLIAGAPFAENSEGDNVGAVRVYREGTSWIKIADLQPNISNFEIDPLFGWSVAIAPGFIAVGAPNAAEGVGAVYIYPFSGDVIGSPSIIQARSGARNFGTSVAVFPTTRGAALVVGASGNSFAGVNGSAFYYEYINNQWIFRQSLTPLFVNPTDGYGFTVKAVGDCVLVSAPGETRVGLGGAGQVYLWRYQFGAFSFDQALTSPPESNAFFGRGMALGTGAIVVGAPGEARLQNGTRPRGAIYFDNGVEGCVSHLPLPTDVIFANGFE